MSEMNGRAEIPRGPSSQIRLWRTPKLGAMIVRFLSPCVGLLTHRPKSADLPCPGADECPPALHRGQSRWKGYAAIVGWRGDKSNDWLPGVVEVTSRFESMLPVGGCVGQAWEIWREPGEFKHDAVTGRALDTVPVPEIDAIAWILPCLCNVYRVASVHLGVANPFRSVVHVEPWKMPPPLLDTPSQEATPQQPQINGKTVKEMLQEVRRSFK